MLKKDIDNLFHRIEYFMDDGVEYDWDGLRHDLEKWPLGEPDE